MNLSTTTLLSSSASSSLSSFNCSNDCATRTATLCVITLFGFLSNLFLIVTIGSSATLRAVPFHCYTLNLASCNLLTCLLGMPLIIGSAYIGVWDYNSEYLCRAQAHFILTTSAATCIGIFIMNMDRVIAISYNQSYKRYFNGCAVWLLVTLSWSIAIFLPLPISLGTELFVEEYQHRYSCSIGSGSNINVLISLYSICFAFPCIINILFFVYIAREALSEKEAQHENSNYSSRLWPEVQSAGIAFVLFLAWVITELPYVIFTSVEQYSISKDVNSTLNYYDKLDTVFTWLKFCDTFLMPLFVFKLRKEIWSKFKDLILCRKSNSVVDSSPRQEKVVPKRMTSGSAYTAPASNTSYNPKSAAPFKVPTLKATNDGLHIQGEIEHDDESLFDMNVTDKSGNILPTTTKALIEHCKGDGIELDEMEAEENGDTTSDYDTDPYSQSDPVSVRSLHNISNISNTPDARDFRRKTNSISVDSGNGSTSSSVTKRKRKRNRVSDDVEQLKTEEISTHTHDSSYSNHSTLEATQQMPNEKSENLPNNKQNITNIDEIVPLDNQEDAVQVKSSKRKKKKKKTANLTDAETNTTQTFKLDPNQPKDRQPPPARLVPIRHRELPVVQTPPLRSKVPRHESDATYDTDALPPAGSASVRSHKKNKHPEKDLIEDGNTCETAEQQALSEPQKEKRKKKNRPRKTSGDSNKPLMSSNTSSEMHSVVNDSGIRESQL